MDQKAGFARQPPPRARAHGRASVVNGNVSFFNMQALRTFFFSAAETLESGGRAGGQKEAFFFHVSRFIFSLQPGLLWPARDSFRGGYKVTWVKPFY